jgi:copper chaperone
MSCHSCVRHVNAALRELNGVDNVDVRLRDGQQKATVNHLSATLREAGYESIVSKAA